MKQILTYILLGILSLSSAYSQESKITAKVSKDTILAGNQISLTISLENVDGEVVKPELIGLEYGGGISQSTSMQYINGEMKKNVQYTYTLIAKEPGNWSIGPVFLDEEKSALETPPISVVVLPNPDGIIEEDGNNLDNNLFFQWGGDLKSIEDHIPDSPQEPVMPKRKLKKI